MIRIQRAPPPPALATAHASHFANIAALPGAAGPLTAAPAHDPAFGAHYAPQPLGLTGNITGYKVARPDLCRMQHNKCAYCEKFIEQPGEDVEHFRPKSCYWWLAWTWENLLFACGECNNPKRARFPLDTPACLQPTAPPPGAESPLLIDPADPADADPLLHLRFHPDDPADPDTNWRPVARSGSRRGAALIAVCRLDRPDLIDAYRDRAREFQTAVEAIEAARPDPVRLTAAWERIARRHLHARVPFAALHHDILDLRFPQPFRNAHRLSLTIRY